MIGYRAARKSQYRTAGRCTGDETKSLRWRTPAQQVEQIRQEGRVVGVVRVVESEDAGVDTRRIDRVYTSNDHEVGPTLPGTRITGETLGGLERRVGRRGIEGHPFRRARDPSRGSTEQLGVDVRRHHRHLLQT